MRPSSGYLSRRVRYRLVVEDPGYRVGTDGSVWSRIEFRRGPVVRYGDWKRLRPTPNHDGYLIVEIRGRKRRVHHLVLEAFVGPCPVGMECRHLDDRPQKNRIDNLAWGTRAENVADTFRRGTAYFLRQERWGERNPNVKLTDAQVALVRATTEPGSRDRGMRAQARRFGVSRALIQRILGSEYRSSPTPERSAA